ncbi:hypothetical protein MGG_04122 [Pyricularia oryzae 70-15]|uniref:BZIP domain-containing protein n=3 Tax=Pyricularia oryzae TaxID=318829 RepID=G4NIT5_PYRO7|nr:uncharacterized protein MGG_04122 [Pyricularia oryzae 70-15]EHA47341.1 hypothetical protein MGG_04122 [Pyricularia oryzae 70-15]ELQ41744.1 hypothetical protein OOU_Y34scaffold00255g42 [Pyricularia oryzae Y34]KAI7918376.1 hypothetical protein M9X92_006930 [Pyricularia oryzae]KAI7932496.1 hypothetical protein M0657_000245 [Pyricularia oryzae]
MSFAPSDSNTSSPVGQLTLPATKQAGLLLPRSTAAMEMTPAPDCNMNFEDWAGVCANSVQTLTPSPECQPLSSYDLNMNQSCADISTLAMTTAQAEVMMAAQYALPTELDGLGPILDFNTMAEQMPSIMAQTAMGDLGSGFDFNTMPSQIAPTTHSTFLTPSTPPCQPFELSATPVRSPARTRLPSKVSRMQSTQAPSGSNRTGFKIPPPSADQPRTWHTWAPWINSLTEVELRKLETRQLAPLYYPEGMTPEDKKMTSEANRRLQQAKNYKRRQINNAAAAKSRRKKVEDRDRALQECELEKEKNKRLIAKLEIAESTIEHLESKLAIFTGVSC